MRERARVRGRADPAESAIVTDTTAGTWPCALLSRRTFLIGAPIVLAAARAKPAAAHAVLLSSSPARRATLHRPPPRVELTFNERLEPAYSTLSVWDAAGTQVDRRDLAVTGEDGRRLSVSLPPLPAGRYTVKFRVLSVDGHIVEASFPFTIAADAAR
jgi:methionine-rich copper-binding protein CopC